jgi:putative secretion ATPase (PEP-CTERM system associated)
MYAEFYKLRAMPFQLMPDARFFFSSRAHRNALAYVMYGLNEGEGFIIITGEVGAGKTTLVSQLLADLDKTRYVTGKIVSTQLGADDMLRMVVSAFGLPQESLDKATLLRRLESFLSTTHAAGRRALLVVDEAQNLSVSTLEELRMLSNFMVGNTAPLQSFLLGQPQFRAILSSPALEQLRQRVIASYHLQPLTQEETRAYVEHRLAKSGWAGDPSFDDDVFRVLFENTQGVPRKINTLCSRILLYGYLEELHRIEAGAVELIARDLGKELSNPADAVSETPVEPVQLEELSASGDQPLALTGPAPKLPMRLEEAPSDPNNAGARDQLLERLDTVEQRLELHERTIEAMLRIGLERGSGSAQ